MAVVLTFPSFLLSLSRVVLFLFPGLCRLIHWWTTSVRWITTHSLQNAASFTPSMNWTLRYLTVHGLILFKALIRMFSTVHVDLLTLSPRCSYCYSGAFFSPTHFKTMQHTTTTSINSGNYKILKEEEQGGNTIFVFNWMQRGMHVCPEIAKGIDRFRRELTIHWWSVCLSLSCLCIAQRSQSPVGSHPTP